MVYTISNRCIEIVAEDKPSVRMELFVSFIVTIPFFTYGIESTCLSASAHAGHFIRVDGVPTTSSVLIVMALVAAPVFCWSIDRLGRRSGVFVITLVQGLFSREEVANIHTYRINLGVRRELTCLLASAHAGYLYFIHPDEDIKVDEVPTISSVLIVMVAAPVFCWSVDRLGRRSGVFVITLVQGASLIPLFVVSPHSPVALHVLAGLAAGGLFTVLPTYQAELTSTSTRGFCMTLMMAMTTLGYMTKLVMALEERMFLMTSLVMLQIILMPCVCESPSYLMMKGKAERSKKTLSKLKRLPEDSPSLQKQMSVLREERERAQSRGKITLISFYRNKIWWDAFKIGLCLYTASVLCGSIVFLDQRKTLAQLEVDLDPQSKLVLAALLAGSLTSLVCVTFLDRKHLLTLGYLVMAISSGVLAVYTQVDLTVATLRWVPVVALATLLLGYGMCWGLHFVILADLFGTEIRATILGILYSYSQVIKLAHVHSFQYLEQHVGIYTMFYIFAGINLYGAVYTLFAVPCTRNRSLKQIEKVLKRPPLPA